MKVENRQTGLLPSGEFLPPSLSCLANQGYSYQNDNDRNYFYTQNNPRKLPLDMLVVRPTDLIPFLSTSQAILGLVGDDIALEKETSPNLLRRIPQELQNRFVPNTQIQLLATPNWDNPNTQDRVLKNTRVFTPYPLLAKKYLTSQGISPVTIEKVVGKIEGLWNIFPDNLAVIDVVASGNTAKANSLTFMAVVMRVTLIGMVKPNLPSIEQFYADWFFQSLSRAIHPSEKDKNQFNKALNGSYRND